MKLGKSQNSSITKLILTKIIHNQFDIKNKDTRQKFKLLIWESSKQTSFNMAT